MSESSAQFRAVKAINMDAFVSLKPPIIFVKNVIPNGHGTTYYQIPNE